MALKVAVVGSGIAGLAAAHTLRGQAEVHLFESGRYFGGHTHTVDVTLPAPEGPVTHGVDTGFLVMNPRTYPQLLKMLAELDVATAPSDMSFSAQVHFGGSAPALEWSGSNLNTVFAQRRNLLRPAFWGMLNDLLRFNRLTTALAAQGADAAMRQPMGDFLRAHRFGDAFCNWYLLPMMACIWSCPTPQMLQFPVATLIRFCHNHGLLQITNRPQWLTVDGGARTYVERIVSALEHTYLNTPIRTIDWNTGLASGAAGGVVLHTDQGSAHFDKVIIASHADQALKMLAQPTPAETGTLGAIRFQPNHAVLHTDTGVMPQRRAAWSAWNYEHAPAAAQENGHVCLHYWINRLQPLPWQQPVMVSLNPVRPIHQDHVLGRFDYDHPVLDLEAIAAQARMPSLQGTHGRYYAGAWMGYGFHEDGFKAGVAAAQRVLADHRVGA